MDKIEIIKSFAREYINGNGRTPERKRIIVETYQHLFDERIRSRCSTCLIEAIFRIINHKTMEKKCHFRLRKGLILQPFGGGIITNDNLTDEIAFECLRTRAANPGMFSIMPEIPMDETKPELEIVPADDMAVGKFINMPVNDIEPAGTIADDDFGIKSVTDKVDAITKPNRPKTYKKRKK